jgi:hypothetical protein
MRLDVNFKTEHLFCGSDQFLKINSFLLAGYFSEKEIVYAPGDQTQHSW